MSIFEPYQLIRIISLPHRKDRRRDMAKQLRKVGLDGDPRVRFFDAVRPADAGYFESVGAHGAFLSHLGVLEEAAGRSVLVLEDDCDFTDAALSTTPAAGVDIFYGGYQLIHPDVPGSDEVIGAHCMGFSARTAAALPTYLRRWFGGTFDADPRALNDGAYDGRIRPPVDGAYVWFRRAHPELAVEFAEPVAAVQRPSRTDIGQTRFFDRMPGLRGLANMARKLR